MRRLVINPPIKEDRKSLVDFGDQAVCQECQRREEISDRAATLCGLNQTADEDATLDFGMINPPYHATAVMLPQKNPNAPHISHWLS